MIIKNLNVCAHIKMFQNNQIKYSNAIEENYSWSRKENVFINFLTPHFIPSEARMLEAM